MKNRTELAKYFARLGFKKGAEIGVAYGYYSKVLLDNIPGLNLFSIDPWIKRGNKTYSMAMEILSVYKDCTILRSSSMDAVKDIADESLDFVFIDADHNYESVKEDIREWSKKVRKGGIISGHDYYVFRYSGNRGVIDAVNEYVKGHGYELNLTDWDKGNPVKDDRQPSWYFFKT